MFHRSGHAGPAATVVLGETDPAVRNRILGPPNGGPATERRELCPPAELAEVARAAVGGVPLST
ncbi:MAG: hypothetical protein GEV11_24580 [Streptosporangiales bacterium]|nr:hypothetical protein [Streptosporangiales bacterium]